MSKFKSIFQALGLSPKTPSIKINTAEDKAIAEERLGLQRQQTESLREQTAFQKQQQQFLMQQQDSSVPKTPAAPEQNTQATPVISSDAESNAALQSRKRGKRSLRIPLATNTGSSGSGVNVPRG